MGEVVACRACLSTDVKLRNLHDFQLKSAFQNLTGITVVLEDGQPQYLCIYCSALLTKCSLFKDRCLKTQQLLDAMVLRKQEITMDCINSLDRNVLNLALPYAIIKTEAYDINGITIKTETDTPFASEMVKDETQSDTSDEEPLSKKIRTKIKTIDKTEPIDCESKKIKNKLKIIDKTEFEEREVKSEENDDSNFIDENIEMDAGKSSSELNSDDIDVLILSRHEQVAEVVQRRESRNYLKALYKCEKCYKGFITNVTYKNHMLRHDPSSGPEVCDICETRWPDIRSLRAHVSTSHERRYTCRLCGHITKSNHRAREHRLWHTGHRFVCKLCGAAFNKSTTHLTHVRLQHPSEYHCDQCGESFISRHGLNIHNRKAHKGFDLPAKYNCEDCGKIFIRLRSLKVHKMKTHGERGISNSGLYKCGSCDVSFRSMGAMDKHTSTIENGICGNSLSPCAQCGDIFSTPDLLRTHAKSHQRDEEVKCEECNKWFAHERSLAAHHARAHSLLPKARHSAPEGKRMASYVCEMCGRKCASKENLVCHQRTHTGEKPFACTECPKRFSIYQRLKIHTRTHTGERPFKCHHCPKAFNQKAGLNRHERVHSGAKPYACAHCGKCFSQSNSMKIHVRTVHLKLPAPYRSRRGKPDQ